MLLKYYHFSLEDLGRLTLLQMNTYMDAMPWINEKMEGVRNEDLPPGERVRRALLKRGAVFNG